MSEIVYLCDAVRTPIGRYGGALSSVRADDLAAAPIKALVERNTGVDWAALDDVLLGCAIKLARITAMLPAWPRYWLAYR